MAVDPKSRPDDRESGFSSAGEVMGVGLQFAGAILIFLFAGRWLDDRLGTSPWLLLLGVFIGAGGGFYSLYRQLVITPRERQQRRREQPDDRPGGERPR